MATIYELPNEIFDRIFKYLTWRTIYGGVVLTCKFLHVAEQATIPVILNFSHDETNERRTLIARMEYPFHILLLITPLFPFAIESLCVCNRVLVSTLISLHPFSQA
jgi:hypothetical protein